MVFVRVVAATVLAGVLGVFWVADEELKPELPADKLPQEVDLTLIPPGFTGLPETPEDNPLTLAKVKLGRKLFFDPILSSDGTVSCASCHHPDHAFAGREQFSTGINGQKTKRNAPSIINRAYGKHFFWDGRSPSLEKQVLGPLSSPAELGGDVPQVIAAIKKKPEYISMFQDAFAGDAEPGVTAGNIAKAIASFERTLLGGNSGVDRFRRGEYAALNREARQGMWIFESRGGCWKCHSGPNFSDESFHNTGVSFGSDQRDTGREQFSGDKAHRFQFKTPTLRDISLTAPYMHDGSMKTLREVVEFYNKGGAPNDPLLDEKMQPLNLKDEEVGFLVEFLKALDSSRE